MPDLPELSDLVAAVVADATDDPLDRLAAAARAREALDDLTDALLDHFVEEARSAGCSWAQIGAAIGVSKQAAQQRHTGEGSIIRRLLSRFSNLADVGDGFGSRFTARTRAAIEAAQTEARRLRHNYIGTEHVLLGLLTEPEAVAPRVLAGLGHDPEAVRAAVEAVVPPGPQPVTGHLPFTPRAKKALNLALRSALDLGHNYIGTEHVLLGLLRLGEGVAHDVLADLGVDQAAARTEVIRLLSGYTGSTDT